MKETIRKNKTDSSIIAKAGLWFTVCNFLFKGMAFLTAPIFTRLLSKKELGEFSNYSTIIWIALAITSLDLSTSIIRSKIEHEKDIDSYVWSILSFSSIFTAVIYLFCILNMKFVSGLLNVEAKYIHVMFFYCLFSPAYSMLITKHRAFYKYKTFVLLTAIVTVSSTLLSIILVLKLDDKLWGRSLGQYLPSILMGVIIFIYIAVNGKKIKLKYWKYALIICVPLVPHVLSLNLLSVSDKLVLTRISGPEITAIYSVASNCYSIVTVMMNSMNSAWTPWLFENLNLKNYNEISKISKKYIIFFTICSFFVMLIGPELILFFGGERYKEAVYCLNPLICSCVIQFIYLFYVNVEFYTKKTIGVSIATGISALINIILNIIFIKMFKGIGYIVASYTTLVGYTILLLLHYYITKLLKMNHVFDNKFFMKLSIITILLSFAVKLLYGYIVLRYSVILIYSIILIYIMYSEKSEIIGILRKR
ncbi:MAG: oligosaccharide flippase family protein [Peptoniphilaceae bacterium]|nr:oligosaccharide flippase family protein [Peptoniphilaceae bacterium]MDY3737905.1 oligosaccharide flippase family protein [Peptoniphilaceae bacterium]